MSLLLCLLLASSCVDEPVKNSVLLDDAQNTEVLSRASSQEGEIEDVVYYGVTSVNYQSKYKKLFDKELADSTGLQFGSTYVVRYIECTLKITLKNQYFMGSPSPKCGLQSRPNGTMSEYVSLKRGYNEISQDDKEVVLKCNIMHIISDLSGREYNIYYPCSIQEIEWRGQMFNF